MQRIAKFSVVSLKEFSRRKRIFVNQGSRTCYYGIRRVRFLYSVRCPSGARRKRKNSYGDQGADRGRLGVAGVSPQRIGL